MTAKLYAVLSPLADAVHTGAELRPDAYHGLHHHYAGRWSQGLATPLGTQRSIDTVWRQFRIAPYVDRNFGLFRNEGPTLGHAATDGALVQGELRNPSNSSAEAMVGWEPAWATRMAEIRTRCGYEPIVYVGLDDYRRDPTDRNHGAIVNTLFRAGFSRIGLDPLAALGFADSRNSSQIALVNYIEKRGGRVCPEGAPLKTSGWLSSRFDLIWTEATATTAFGNPTFIQPADCNAVKSEWIVVLDFPTTFERAVLWGQRGASVVIHELGLSDQQLMNLRRLFGP